MGVVGFMGPSYTFSERAARALAGDGEIAPLNSVDDVFGRLVSGQTDFAATPIENDFAGYVPTALAAARRLETPLRVVREHVEDIRFSLYQPKAQAGARREKIVSHPMSLKQCRAWTEAQGVETEEEATNGSAFVRARDGGEPGIAAIGPSGLDDPAMLEVETDLQGPQANRTRFLLLERQPAPASCRRALLAIDALEKLLDGNSPQRLVVAGAPRPLGALGAYEHIVECAFRSPILLTELETCGAVALLTWS